MKRNIIKIGIITTLSSISISALADQNFEVGTFSGERNLTYSIDSSGADSKYGSPTSKLDFDGSKVSGVYIGYKIEDRFSYSHFKGTIGYGSSDGVFDDKDWYSKSYANSISSDELFSWTKSKSQIDQDLTFSFDSGKYLYSNPFGFDKSSVGFGTYAQYTSYTGKGLTKIKGSAPNYNDNIDVISIENYFFEGNINFKGTKYLSKNLYFDIELYLSPYQYQYMSDTHILRSDLGDPSVEIARTGYGARSKVSLSYDVNDYSIKLWGEFYKYNDYGSGKVVFHSSDGTSSSTGFDSLTMSGNSIGLSLSKSF